MAENSPSATVTWIKVDERVYVDAMAVEVLLLDFSERLEDEDDSDGAEAIRRVPGMFAALSAGRKDAIQA